MYMNDYNIIDFYVICSYIVKKIQCRPVNNEFPYWTINTIQFNIARAHILLLNLKTLFWFSLGRYQLVSGCSTWVWAQSWAGTFWRTGRPHVPLLPGICIQLRAEYRWHCGNPGTVWYMMITFIIVIIRWYACTNLYFFIVYFSKYFDHDYLKNPIHNHLQISSVSLALSGIVQLSFSVWSLNHDVIQAPFREFTLSSISS